MILESEPERQALRERWETEVRPFFGTGEEGCFEGTGGVILRYVHFPAGSGDGALVLLPGKGEPYLKYAELLYDLRGLGLSLYGFDHRGMGRSDRLLPERRKVHVESFGDYVADAAAFVQRVVRRQGPRRVAVLGHSTGGLVAARLLQEHPGLVDAAVLSSPAFAPRLGSLPPWLVRTLARALDRPGRGTEYAPGEEHAERVPFQSNLISHSLARWEIWEQAIPAEHPELILGGVTRRWLRELTEAGRRALAVAAAVCEPVLLLQAADDRVVRTEPQERFCRRCRTCTLVCLEAARHELLIEADCIREQALERIRSFLQPHVR